MHINTVSDDRDAADAAKDMDGRRIDGTVYLLDVFLIFQHYNFDMLFLKRQSFISPSQTVKFLPILPAPGPLCLLAEADLQTQVLLIDKCSLSCCYYLLVCIVFVYDSFFTFPHFMSFIL